MSASWLRRRGSAENPLDLAMCGSTIATSIGSPRAISRAFVQSFVSPTTTSCASPRSAATVPRRLSSQSSTTSSRIVAPEPSVAVQPSWMSLLLPRLRRWWASSPVRYPQPECVNPAGRERGQTASDRGKAGGLRDSSGRLCDRDRQRHHDEALHRQGARRPGPRRCAGGSHVERRADRPAAVATRDDSSPSTLRPCRTSRRKRRDPALRHAALRARRGTRLRVRPDESNEDYARRVWGVTAVKAD